MTACFWVRLESDCMSRIHVRCWFASKAMFWTGKRILLATPPSAYMRQPDVVASRYWNCEKKLLFLSGFAFLSGGSKQNMSSRIDRLVCEYSVGEIPLSARSRCFSPPRLDGGSSKLNWQRGSCGGWSVIWQPEYKIYVELISLEVPIRTIGFTSLWRSL
jgi:hypothetical protein